MEHISSLLTKLLQKRGLKDQADASLIVHQAQDWLEQELPQFVEHLQVSTYKDGTLQIGCKHSIAAQECQQVVPKLLRYLQEECEHRSLEDVRLVRES